MAQPSILQPVGGPLAGRRFEFYGKDVLIGTAPECGVRVEAPGVAERHAQIIIEITGATIQRVDGIVGVNDDVVMGDSLLRSGDFVWLGEPGGATSIMLQFTLGDGEEAEAPAAAAGFAAGSDVRTIEPQEEAPMEMVAEEASFPQASFPQASFDEAQPVEMAGEAEVMEMAPDGVEEAPQVLEAAAYESAPVEEAVVEEIAEPMVAEAPQVEEAQFQEPGFEEPHFQEPHFEEPALAVEPPPELSGAEIESMTEMESELHGPDDLAPAPPPAAVKTVPPAPWLTPAAPEAAPAADYASSWEQAPKAPAPEEQEATMMLPASPVAAPRPVAPPSPPPPAPKPAPQAAPAPPRRPATPPMQTGPTTRPKPKAAEPAPPPAARPAARTTSSAPMIVGGLVALVVLGGGAFFMLRPAEAPAPTPTPVPTPVVVATPPPVEATPEVAPTQVAVVEPTPEAAPPVAAPATPTPRAGTTPSPRSTPTPRTTPTPVTPRPGTVATPTPAPTVAAPAAPVSQAPKLLEEAKAAIAAKDFPKAQQILDQVLRLEPGNAEATTRKAEVAARLAAMARKFTVGATSVIGGKTAKGPSGFDLGGGGVVKTDFSAQIRCTTTPATVEEGTFYTVRCAIVNIGTKAFKLENVAANETRDGAKTPGTGTTPRGDLAPQSETTIVEKTGAWSAKSQWSLEIVAKTNKDESFRAVYNWR